MAGTQRWIAWIGAFLLMGMVVASGSRGQSRPEDGILGVWDDHDQGARIEVFRCGELTCGKIVGLNDPDAGGKPKLDANNPDKRLRSRPIIGLQVLTGFKYAGDDTWTGGSVYSPERGKTYSATLTLVEDRLDVKVSVWPVHKTVEWIRPAESGDIPKTVRE
jgi:uncharacterized protein (DUF2147 family)